MKKTAHSALLDEIKAIACIFVIFIHCKFPGVTGDIFEALARFAVPFFFVISGKYLLKKSCREPSEIRKAVLKKTEKLLGILFPVWIFYTLYSFWYSLTVDHSVQEWLSDKYNSFEFSRLILFNSGKFIYDFTYAFDHLWFIFALVYVYLLVIVFARFVRAWAPFLTVALIVLLFVLELLQTYYPIRPFDISISTWYVVRNWLFVGVPFTMLGVWFSDKLSEIEFFSNYSAGLTFLALGILSTLAEYSILKSKEVYLGSLLIVLGLLILENTWKINGKKNIFGLKTLGFVGSVISSHIYYLHVFVISLFGWFIDRINPELYGNEAFMYARPLIVIVLTLILSLAIYIIKALTIRNKNV
ncbi:acyltransferase family protein [Butyrivibrio sp. WCD3002]|uniref:acyltransferase family protein n=1 Tax=Butyrivibrio sp. WCD3002 TaxID=1280676 RepID=UPI00042061E1|nr:acyltransferase [Butyrivibrio sp. WCD3002]